MTYAGGRVSACPEYSASLTSTRLPRAGYACQVVHVDDNSVNVQLAARGKVHETAVLRSPKIDIQLKATAQQVLKKDHLAFALPVKNYNDLREESLVPRLLVVLVLPQDETQWLEQTEEQMISRHCAYWSSLLGREQRENAASVTVRLPPRTAVHRNKPSRHDGEGLQEGAPMTAMTQPPFDQLAALRSEDVQLYLSSQGWRRDDASSTAQGNVYRFPALRDAEALLPARRDLADYTERMGDVVQMLAAVEERSVWQVMADLSTPPADVLRLQVTAPTPPSEPCRWPRASA